MSEDMYEGEIEGAPFTKRRRQRGVRIDHSSSEALQESTERFYAQNSPENLEKQVMALRINYYVFGITKEGKRIFDGPFLTLSIADSELAKFDDGEIFESQSRSLAKATREIKSELIKRGEDPDSALKRLSHKIFRRKKR